MRCAGAFVSVFLVILVVATVLHFIVVFKPLLVVCCYCFSFGSNLLYSSFSLGTHINTSVRQVCFDVAVLD